MALRLDTFFDPMKNEVCWRAVHGHGSIITLDFGTPVVDVGAVRERSTFDETGAKFTTPRRSAHVRGSWYLWIQASTWEVSIGDRVLAHAESTRSTTSRALGAVAGQTIVAAEKGLGSGPTRFHFDLGATITVGSSDGDGVGAAKRTEQWWLRQPNGMILTVRNDGLAGVASEHATKDNDIDWTPIT